MLTHEMNLSETIINGLPGIFYVAATDGKLVRWNKNVELLSGYSSEELAGKYTTDFVGPNQVDFVLDKRQEALAGGKSTAEFTIYTKGNERLDYYITIMPIMYNGSEHLLGIGIDFTEKKRAELELLKKNTEIRERMKELGCLYRVSEIVHSNNDSIAQIMEECVRIIPTAYRYQEITCVCIEYREQVFRSAGFKETEWLQAAELRINGQVVGAIKVFYKEEMPAEAEGPFSVEERLLLNSMVGILSNAVEKRLASEEIIRLNRLYQFKSAINEMCMRAADSETIFREACDIAVEHGKFRMAWMGQYSPDEENLVFFAASGHEDGYLNQIRASFDTDQFYESPAGIAIRTGAHYYCNDIAHDPRIAPWKNEALARGFRSSICLPVIIDGKIAALYTLYMSEPFFFNDTEIKLLKDATDNIAFALDKIRIRLEGEASLLKLAESEEKFRKLVEETIVGVFILQDEHFRYVNPRFANLSGYTEEELLHTLTFDQLIHCDDVDRVRRKYLLRLGGEVQSHQYSFKAVAKDGSIRNIELIASEISYQSRPAIIGTIIDITEQVKEEKRISKAVINAQENERLQIGMELHDNVKQIIATSLLNLHLVKSSLDNVESMQEYLGNAQARMLDAIKELRRISHRLTPSVESSQPFAEKILTLVDSMNVGNRLKISVDFDSITRSINNELQLAFYRILQEQLSNILKYAKATTVAVNFHYIDQVLTMSVHDDGVGFDTSTRQAGIGLENIRRRAHVLNGKMNVLSATGQGCQLSVEVPC